MHKCEYCKIEVDLDVKHRGRFQTDLQYSCGCTVKIRPDGARLVSNGKIVMDIDMGADD